MAVAFAVGLTVPVPWLGPASLALLPVAVLLGLDRYRNLGHQLTARYLVTRQGSVMRRTVALQRAGRDRLDVPADVFQRRAGLVDGGGGHRGRRRRLHRASTSPPPTA